LKFLSEKGRNYTNLPTINEKTKTMKRSIKKSMVLICIIFFTLKINAQNTPPSCVITFPHCNAYFMQGTDVTIRVYATDMGGTGANGTVSKVEFFKDDVKLGETSTATSNTYSFLWTSVLSGTYQITAKATDNGNTVSTSAGVIITVGSEAVKSEGMSAGKGKYLANVNGYNRPDFMNYWNGVTAENSCKWGSVEAVRDVMVWTNADKSYNFAKTNHLGFRYHALVWGSQYPAWIKDLSPADFQAEMEEYMAAVAARYPLIDQIDVLNENMYLNSWNKKEHADGTPYFRAGLGGPGVTGYDWAIWLFEKARFYFPNAKLVMNDFELETNSAGLNEMLAVIKVLRDRGLIDGIGTQAHYFNLDGTQASTLQNALNAMAKSGLPIYVTELDLKGSPATEAGQESKYKALFPVYWNHPAVAGITLWGYVEGTTWAAGTGLLNADGTERSAMTWLKSYMKSLPDVGYPFKDLGGTNGISPFIDNQVFRVYPNPATSGKVTIENISGKTINLIEVIDIQGKLVKTVIPGNKNIEIEVSDLKKGIYFLRVLRENVVLDKKLIIL
jgi:GH35 family endo-1,4-beta-xylanase